MSKAAKSREKTIFVYFPPVLLTNYPVFAEIPALISSDVSPNGRPILTVSKPVISIDHLPLRPVFHDESKIIATHGNLPV